MRARSDVPASVEWLLSGDAVERATAAWHLGWPVAHEASGDDWQAGVLAQGLEDPYSAVRYRSGHSLQRLPGLGEFQYDFVAAPEDQGGAVRRALALAPATDFGPGVIEALQSMRDESDITIRE